MRDIMTIPISGEDSLLIACDNSGAIGMKEHDLVRVPYEMVSYYSFRVAAMEVIAAGGEIVSVVLNNFCGNEPWGELVKGIQNGLDELGLKDVVITGSTESNFELKQSAIGIQVMGKTSFPKTTKLMYSQNIKIAVIGLPLVGNEVIEQEEHVVPLSIFHNMSRIHHVAIWPVGSKGILFELNQMFSNIHFTRDMVNTDVDIVKSSGPATCFVVAYYENDEDKIKELSKGFFHPVEIKK